MDLNGASLSVFQPVPLVFRFQALLRLSTPTAGVHVSLTRAGHGPFSAQLGAYTALVRPCYHGPPIGVGLCWDPGRFNALHGRLEEKLPEVMGQK